MGCGCGLIGGYVLSPGNQDPVYSKPIPRGGPSAVFSFEVLQADTSVDFVVVVEQRNNAGSWSTLASFQAGINSVGVYTKHASGIEQLVRYKAHFDTSTASGDMVRIAFGEPMWLAT